MEAVKLPQFDVFAYTHEHGYLATERGWVAIWSRERMARGCRIGRTGRLGKLTQADSGQLHRYLSYAREHWIQEGENPPVGLILCSKPDGALAK